MTADDPYAEPCQICVAGAGERCYMQDDSPARYHRSYSGTDTHHDRRAPDAR